MQQKLGVAPELKAGSGGVFDVWADGKRVFSKHEEGDFPDEGDVLRRIRGAR
ncbi:MAG: Rdx family protein [Acidobacteria bacterium]|nr:Rdx family protein [Acidobacteriota bacterium]